jgi:Ser/Thr protein kinase RdoA (MazF antagonist)
VLRHLSWLAERQAERPSSLVHSDLRADNLLFGDPRSSDAVVILDWQLATRSMAANDPTRLLGGSEPASQRNGHHLEVFTAWHETLISRGVTDYEFDEALEDFRLGALFNLLIPVKAYGMTAGTTSVRTARLVDAIVDRMYVSAMELDAGSLLPTR